MSYLHLPSTAVGDTTPIDDPSNCECGGKGCDCACHVPTRDNTTTDDDLALDRLKAERDDLRERNLQLVTLVERLESTVSFGADLVSKAVKAVERLTVERDSLAATVEEYARNGWASVISKLWGAGDFCGPCAHGRDPYTRCDECEDLTPRQALERALLAPVTAERDQARGIVNAVKHEQDRERQAIKASDCDALCKCAAGRHCTETAPCLRHVLLAQRDAARAAIEHLDEFAPLGLVDGVKAMRVALIALRAELAATRAGADHLQTSLQRANARIDALATESAGLLRERNDLRELLRMAGVTP